LNGSVSGVVGVGVVAAAAVAVAVVKSAKFRVAWRRYMIQHDNTTNQPYIT
jgi:hypothetical protein